MGDDEAMPLSALQHWACCPRQCGLIHLEQTYDDNLHTLRRQAAHAHVERWLGIGSAPTSRTRSKRSTWRGSAHGPAIRDLGLSRDGLSTRR